MGVVTPAPNVLGICSLTAAVDMVCFVNLIISIYVIAVVDSAKSVIWAGVEISPEMQCLTAAWYLIGIPVAVYGGVGAVYRVEANLQLYYYYLVGCLAVTVLWIFILLKYSNGCGTVQPQSPMQTASFACNVNNAMTIFWMCIMCLAILFALYLVWSKIDYCRKRLEMDLVRYQEPWQMVAALADDVAAEEARELAMSNPKVTGAAMPAASARMQTPQGYTGFGPPKGNFQY